MCKAFSCITLESGRVVWKLGVDSHEKLLEREGIRDDQLPPTFARVEISPANGDYRKPDRWIFKLDEEATPAWWSTAYEAACWAAHRSWSEQLYSILDTTTKVVNPFTITPPKRITKRHIALLKDQASVRASVRASVGVSVRASVWDSVWDSVWASVWDSVGASVGDSVWNSVWDSVWDSVWAKIGSLFHFERGAWLYAKHIKTEKYPFQSAVDLWNLGLVPSFDGTTWRLHGGTNGQILFEISKTELMKDGE